MYESDFIVKSPSTHYLHSSHRDKQTTRTTPVSRKSVQSHRVRPLKYAYLNPSRKGSASFLSPRAKSLSLRQLARLAASTLYSRTSAGPHRFPPPPKKRNGCDTTNVIIFRQLTKQTEYIVTTEKSSIKRKGRCPNFRFTQSRKSDNTLSPFNKYDTSKTESGTPQHRHSNTPECPRPEDCRQTRTLRNQYRTLC